ncbi:MAG: hypothetical protein JXA66_04645, partial [Oligoflexia bacterium]|nr:hypothetical protein [Oligoflexia bacterium]
MKTLNFFVFGLVVLIFGSCGSVSGDDYDFEYMDHMSIEDAQVLFIAGDKFYKYTDDNLVEEVVISDERRNTLAHSDSYWNYAPRNVQNINSRYIAVTFGLRSSTDFEVSFGDYGLIKGSFLVDKTTGRTIKIGSANKVRDGHFVPDQNNLFYNTPVFTVVGSRVYFIAECVGDNGTMTYTFSQIAFFDLSEITSDTREVTVSRYDDYNVAGDILFAEAFSFASGTVLFSVQNRSVSITSETLLTQ